MYSPGGEHRERDTQTVGENGIKREAHLQTLCSNRTMAKLFGPSACPRRSFLAVFRGLLYSRSWWHFPFQDWWSTDGLSSPFARLICHRYYYCTLTIKGDPGFLGRCRLCGIRISCEGSCRVVSLRRTYAIHCYSFLVFENDFVVHSLNQGGGVAVGFPSFFRNFSRIWGAQFVIHWRRFHVWTYDSIFEVVVFGFTILFWPSRGHVSLGSSFCSSCSCFSNLNFLCGRKEVFLRQNRGRSFVWTYQR
jgi:hypothetical protein